MKTSPARSLARSLVFLPAPLVVLFSRNTEMSQSPQPSLSSSPSSSLSSARSERARAGPGSGASHPVARRRATGSEFPSLAHAATSSTTPPPLSELRIKCTRWNLGREREGSKWGDIGTVSRSPQSSRNETDSGARRGDMRNGDEML